MTIITHIPTSKSGKSYIRVLEEPNKSLGIYSARTKHVSWSKWNYTTEKSEPYSDDWEYGINYIYIKDLNVAKGVADAIIKYIKIKDPNWQP